jgi:uncharacterized damage-inducible protein DinB
MTVERADVPRVADEITMLTAWLDYHRDTLALKCDGVPPDRLAEQTVPPSSLSLLGLVRHMAEVERGWFRRGVAGQEAGYLYVTDDDEERDFDDAHRADPDEALATWRAECDAARAISASHSLDETFTRRDRTYSHRWVLQHMIEEYARHNGHADLIRECLDGVVGD